MGKHRTTQRRAPVGKREAKRRQLILELRHLHCEEHKFLARMNRAFSELDRVRHQLQSVYTLLGREYTEAEHRNPSGRLPL